MRDGNGRELGSVRGMVATYCPNCASRHQTSLFRLERAMAALNRARIADRHYEFAARRHALAECKEMLLALHRDVETEQPFAEILETVFGVGVERIEAALRHFETRAIDLVQRDLDDLLAGFRVG